MFLDSAIKKFLLCGNLATLDLFGDDGLIVAIVSRSELRRSLWRAAKANLLVAASLDLDAGLFVVLEQLLLACDQARTIAALALSSHYPDLFVFGGVDLSPLGIGNRECASGREAFYFVCMV